VKRESSIVNRETVYGGEVIPVVGAFDILNIEHLHQMAAYQREATSLINGPFTIDD
jgi:hypothetical protein